MTGYDFQTAAVSPLFSPHEMLMSFKKEFLEVWGVSSFACSDEYM